MESIKKNSLLGSAFNVRPIHGFDLAVLYCILVLAQPCHVFIIMLISIIGVFLDTPLGNVGISLIGILWVECVASLP